MREMKETGIKSIGIIPYFWIISRLKYEVELSGRIGYRGYTQQDLVDEGEGAITLSPSNLKDGKMNYDKCSYISWYKYNESPEIKVKNGYLLIVKTGSSYGKTSIVENLPLESTINPQLLVIKPISCNNRYLCYVMQTSILRHQIENAVVGGTIPTVAQEKINNFYFPLPNTHIQKNIVSFLDSKCSEIDSLAEDIQAQIDALEQYKRSVITEAVTKGLDKNVPMKEDNQLWFGKIPKTWESLKGKYLFEQRNQKGNSICCQLLSPTQKYGVIPQEKYEELSGNKAVKLKENTNYNDLKTIHKGDYCISLRSFQGGFEYSEYEGVVSPAYQVFYPTLHISSGYYKYLFKETGFIEKMNSYAMSLRDGKNIAFEDFGRTHIPVPPFEEQKAIAYYLDEICNEVNSTITVKQEQLSVLADYKKSLIYEYVTGKKEVPNE